MKKSIIISLVLIISAIYPGKNFAQSKFKVGISMGPVIPLNEFKSSDYNTMPVGFSQSGFSLSFDGDYYFIHRLALSARFNFGLTSMDKVSVANWLDTQMSEYLSDNADNNLYSIDYWQWSAPMIGLKFNYPIVINKLYFDLDGYSGLSIVQIPNQNLKIIDEKNKQAIYSENVESKSYAVPVMFDGGFRFMATKQVQFKLFASYFQSKSSFQHVDYIVKEGSSDVWQELGKSDYNLPLKTVSFNIGIIYNL